MMFNKSFLNILLILGFVMAISYWQVPFLFFQQDEWLVFGLIINQGTGLILRGLGTDKIFHFIPIDQLLNYYSFTLFKLNNIPYNLTGLLFHFINGLLIFILSYRLFKNRLFALLSSIIFLTSGIAAQLVMWPLVSLNIISLSFTLVVFYLVYEGKTDFKRSLLIALFTTLALLTLEYSIGLLIFVPLITLLKAGKKDLKKTVIFMIPTLIIGGLYCLIRLYPFLISHQQAVVDSLPTAQSTVLGFKLSRLPIRYLGQLFISEDLILSLSKSLSRLLNINDSLLYSKITGIIGAIILTLSVFTWAVLRRRYQTESKIILIIFIFIISSTIPFIFIPGQSGDFTLFPPRYLYYGVAGGSMLIAYFSYLAFFHKKNIFRVGIVVAVLFLIISGIWQNWRREDILYNQGLIRKSILKTINASYPTLGKKVVFFTKSDTPYYGLPPEEKILPFQSGFGQTLLIWYYPSERFPKGFYENKFLWEIQNQGYKEIEGKGFGYFRDLELLKKNVKQYNIPSGSVIAFSWEGKTNILRDITKQVRAQIEQEIDD